MCSDGRWWLDVHVPLVEFGDPFGIKEFVLFGRPADNHPVAGERDD